MSDEKPIRMQRRLFALAKLYPKAVLSQPARQIVSRQVSRRIDRRVGYLAAKGVPSMSQAALRAFSSLSLDRAAAPGETRKAVMAAEAESAPTQGDASRRGEHAATISRSMVALLRRTSGRGPTRARTTIGRDHVLVMFENTLSEGERNLVSNGHRDQVVSVRRAYQELMEAEACDLIAEITGRGVRRFMSANQLDSPDVAAEIFLFEPDGHPDAIPEEAEHLAERGAEPGP